MKATHKSPTIPLSTPSAPFALSLEQAASLSGIGRSSLYAAIREGRLVARKMGRRTVLLKDDFERYLAALPTIKTQAPAA